MVSMRSFANYISEESRTSRAARLKWQEDLCAILSMSKEDYEPLRKTPQTRLQGPLHQLVFDLNRWSIGWTRGKDSDIPREDIERRLIQAVFNCPKRAMWTMLWRQASVYRGFWKTPTELGSMEISIDPNLTGESVMGSDGFSDWVIGRAKYKSKHMLQSWTERASLARSFSTGLHTGVAPAGTYRTVVKHNPRMSDTVALDAISYDIDNAGENEIIVKGKGAKGVMVAISARSIVENSMEFDGRELAVYVDRIASVFGNKNAEAILLSPGFRKAKEEVEREHSTVIKILNTTRRAT